MDAVVGLRHLIESKGIECALTTADAITFFASHDEGTEQVNHELDAALRAGLAVEATNDIGVPHRGQSRGEVRDQFHLNPAQLCSRPGRTPRRRRDRRIHRRAGHRRARPGRHRHDRARSRSLPLRRRRNAVTHRRSDVARQPLHAGAVLRHRSLRSRLGARADRQPAAEVLVVARLRDLSSNVANLGPLLRVRQRAAPADRDRPGGRHLHRGRPARRARSPASAAGSTSGSPSAPAAGSRPRARAAAARAGPPSPTSPCCRSGSRDARQGMTLQAIADVLNDGGRADPARRRDVATSSVQRATGYRRRGRRARHRAPKSGRPSLKRGVAPRTPRRITQGSGVDWPGPLLVASLEESRHGVQGTHRRARGPRPLAARRARRTLPGSPGPARRPEGPADLGRRNGAGLRRVEGRARSRGRALRHVVAYNGQTRAAT